MSWVDFWDGDHSIYVNRTHLDAHYCRLLKDLVPLLPAAPFTLLDFGCGDALMAPELAAKGGTVVLYDAAPKKRDTLRARYGAHSGIQVLDDLAAQPEQSCDLVIMISVAQYIDRDVLAGVLAPIKRALKPGGRLIIADIIPPGGSLLRDVAAFLGFAAGNGFLVAALAGLARTLFSDYSRLRKQLGLSTYAVEDMVALLGTAGWRVEKLPRNVGFDPNRWSAVVAAQ